MKKVNIILVFVFAIAYAVILSIGMVCFLNLLGISFAISLDGRSVVNQYPRFIPFCLVVGFLALMAIVILLVINIKISEKFIFTKKIWCAQMISALVISIPMIKLWEMLFDFLQKVF